MSDKTLEPIAYSLDDRNRIVRVNAAWTRFALDNDAPELAPEYVLERSILDFLGDTTTCQIYLDLLARVRQGIPARFSIRCDSPGLRRHVQLTVTAVNSGLVDFRSLVLAMEPRAVQRVWDRRIERDERQLRTCAWCKRVHVGGEWLEIEHALATLGIFELEPLPTVTHGICDECQGAMHLVHAGLEPVIGGAR
jgi:hypothetical protein